MIKSLSPYYLEIPFVAPLSGLTCTEYLLQIFVWNGSKDIVPSTPSYEKTILNPTASTGDSRVNIARLVNDFINFTPYDTLDTELINGNNQQWVKTQVLYVTADEDDYVAQLESTVLMTKGYGYGMEGENPQIPSDKIMLSGREFKVNRSGFFCLPILIDETNEISGAIEITAINYDSSTSTEAQIDISYTITGFTPVNVTLQTNESGSFEWVDQATYTNTSPINNVIITYPVDGSTNIRLVFTDSGDLYVSNIENIGVE